MHKSLCSAFPSRQPHQAALSEHPEEARKPAINDTAGCQTLARMGTHAQAVNPTPPSAEHDSRLETLNQTPSNMRQERRQAEKFFFCDAIHNIQVRQAINNLLHCASWDGPHETLPIP